MINRFGAPSNGRSAEHVCSECFAQILREEIAGRYGIISAKMHVSYEKDIRVRENVAIGCRVGRIGTKSLGFRHEFWSDHRALLCATIGRSGARRSSCPPSGARELPLSRSAPA